MRIPKEILAIRTVAARESTRYAINGVRFARAGDLACAEATDGRMLLAAQWIDGSETTGKFETILGCAQLRQVKTPARIKQVELKETDVNGAATIRALSAVNPKFGDDKIADIAVDTIDGHFPKTEQVVPDYDVTDKSACHVFAVDPTLLATLLGANMLFHAVSIGSLPDSGFDQRTALG